MSGRSDGNTEAAGDGALEWCVVDGGRSERGGERRGGGASGAGLPQARPADAARG